MASRNMSFLWYDYETSGRDPRRHRPVQFAGVRTDDALNELGEPLVWYCRPARDLLPEPGAVLVHGHAPSLLEKQGLSEAAFAEKIHEELSGPDVCAVGYNAIRFDHEHTRFLFYRNLLDPYAWHWKNGNTRWDVIDLFRAAYALRPEGIQWPLRKDARNGNEERPSFRLQDLAAENNIGGHGVPHEALADVRTMIELVRLVRDRQPKLFDWALRIRDKRVVAAVMRGENPHSDQKPIEKEDCFVWVASLFQRQGCASPVFRMASHPNYSDAVIVFDLSQDPSELAGLSDEALRDRLFRPGSRSPVFVVKANRCPFVAPYSLLTDEVLGRMGLDRDTLEARYRMLSDNAALRDAVQAAYAHPPERAREAPDVDEALYEKFISDKDQATLSRLREELQSLSKEGSELRDKDRATPARLQEKDWTLAAVLDKPFEDAKLKRLASRYLARNFFRRLHPADQEDWRAHCRKRHLTPGEDGRTALDAWRAEIAELRREHAGAPDKMALLDDLEGYGRRLADWLGEQGALVQPDGPYA